MKVIQSTYNVAVVVPTYNRLNDLLVCLKSIYCQIIPGVQVIVVNDGSNDNTTIIVREQYSDVIVLEGSGNLWWSGAVNLGVEYALAKGFDRIILLNDDNVLSERSLTVLCNYSEDHPNAIIGSIVLIKGTQLVAYAGGGINWFRGGPFQIDYRKRYCQQYLKVLEVDYLGGQGVLIPARVFEKVGRFDQEAFPQYYGDADFCLRARKVGVRVVVHPESIVFDGENPDGFSRYGFQKGFHKLVEAYTSRRSSVNVVDTTKFFLRHCPFWLVPWALSWRFLRFAKGHLRSSLLPG